MNKKMKVKQDQEKWLVGLKNQMEQTQKRKKEDKFKVQEENQVFHKKIELE